MHAPEKPKNPDAEGALDSPAESSDLTARARARISDLLQKPFNVRSLSLSGLFVLASFYTIYFMRSILLPIVLAMLLSYLLRPVVRFLAKGKISPVLGSALILLVLLAAIGYGVSVLAGPAAGWLAKAPSGLSELQKKLSPVKKSMAQVEQAGGEIEKITTPAAPSKQTVEVRLTLSSI